MIDRPMTDEERRVLEHAADVVRTYLSSGSFLPLIPVKMDCVAIYCHPDDEHHIRAMYDAPIVVDHEIDPGTIGIVPFARADTITMTVGFSDPRPVI